MTGHDVRSRLLAELREQGPATTRELARWAQCDRRYAREVLVGLMYAGLARRWKQPGAKREFVWELEPLSPAGKTRASCQRCGKVVTLTKQGGLHRHVTGTIVCPGSGGKP